jgi:Mg2+ and Co2+ transporter CorA
VLSVIGVSTVVFVPVVIGTAIVVALWSSSGGLGLRVKSKIVAATEPKFAELHQRLQQSLDSTVTEVFTTLRTEVEHTLVGHIEAEIRNIEDTIELTQRSEQERLREIATIRADVTALDQRHSELEDAVSKASMGEARPGQHHR